MQCTSSPLLTVMIACTVIVLSCQGRFETDMNVCDPRVLRLCDCPGGGESTQVCSDDGLEWGACQCSGSDADIQVDAEISTDAQDGDGDRYIEDDGDTSAVDAAPDVDDAPDEDAGDWPLACDWRGEFLFVNVEPVTVLNSDESEGNITLSRDGLRIYFSSRRSDGVGGKDVYTSTRPSLEGSFEPPVLVEGEVNTEANEDRFSVTPDGLEAYWASDRVGGVGEYDIWTATRSSISAPFTNAEVVPILSTPFDDYDPVLSPDGLTLLVSPPSSYDDQDIVAATRNSLEDPFGDAPLAVPGLDTRYEEYDASMTEEGRVILFVSVSRPESVGDDDLWYAILTDDGYSEAHPVPGTAELNTADSEGECVVRADGCEIFFTSNRAGGLGGHDIYRAVFSLDP